MRCAALLMAMHCHTLQAQAIDVTENQAANFRIEPVLDLSYGIFHSHQSYQYPSAPTHKSWQEAYALYGLTGEYQRQHSTLYASLKGVSTGSFGDGDAAGFTQGTERKTNLEEWRIGWRNGSAEDARIDLSLGRQNIQIADGFLVAGDALNMGQGIADGELNRGGAYYLAGRKSFDFTTVLHYQFSDQLKSHWYYLASNNKAQYQPKLWSMDWHYQFAHDQQTGYPPQISELGLTYLQVSDVEDPVHESGRQALKDLALRGKMQLIEQLGLNAEYVYQDKQQGHEQAWYLALNYHLDQLPWQPVLSYRYSFFSEDYDPLFYGNTEAGFGTWFQGEVAANYAGPFSRNARIQQVAVQAAVKDNLHLGVLAYRFDTLKKQHENLAAHEWDVFAVWSPIQKVNVIPLVGFYTPKKDINHGGTQVHGTSTNRYAQLILQYVY